MCFNKNNRKFKPKSIMRSSFLQIPKDHSFLFRKSNLVFHEIILKKAIFQSHDSVIA